MVVKITETKEQTVKSGTYDGIYLNAVLKHTTANTAFSSSDFLPEMVAVKVTLMRGERNYVIMNNNLKLLGTYNTLKNGYHEYLNGIYLVQPASGVAGQLLRTAKLKFGSPIRVASGEELTIEVTFNNGGLSTNCDQSISYVEFIPNKCIGYEVGVPRTEFKVVQANSPSEQYSLGDHVLDLKFLNFDKTSLASPVIASASLTSDRLDWNLTFNQLIARNVTQESEYFAQQFSGGTPLLPGSTSIFRSQNRLPQCLILFDGNKYKNEVNDAELTMQFNDSAVAASQNFVGWTRYTTDLATLKETAARMQKHTDEDIEKVAKDSK